jgi:hypothetical protein
MPRYIKRADRCGVLAAVNSCVGVASGSQSYSSDYAMYGRLGVAVELDTLSTINLIPPDVAPT